MTNDPWMAWNAIDAELSRMEDGLAALSIIAPYRLKDDESEIVMAVRFVVTELERSVQIGRDAMKEIELAIRPPGFGKARDAAS